MAEKVKTTMGDRLSTGAVNAGFGGGLMLASAAAVNGVMKFTKFGSKRPIVGKVDWFITGITAAVAGIYGFVTANKGNEIAKEKAINEVLERAAARPNDPAAQKMAEKEIEVIIEHGPQSTKYRDLVNQSRAQSAERVPG